MLSSAPGEPWRGFDAQAQSLARALRAGRLTVLVGAADADMTKLLVAGVLPLLHRRVGDERHWPGGAPLVAESLTDRRHRTWDRDHGEMLHFVDQWTDAPLDSLVRALDDLSATAAVRLDLAAATSPEHLSALSRRHGGEHLLFVFDHFELLLECANHSADLHRFLDAWAEVVHAPDLDAHFLVAADEHAWSWLRALCASTSKDQPQAFRLQVQAGDRALESLTDHPLDGSAAEAEVDPADFAASLNASLAKVVREEKPQRQSDSEVAASLNASFARLVPEVRIRRWRHLEASRNAKSSGAHSSAGPVDPTLAQGSNVATGQTFQEALGGRLVRPVAASAPDRAGLASRRDAAPEEGAKAAFATEAWSQVEGKRWAEGQTAREADARAAQLMRAALAAEAARQTQARQNAESAAKAAEAARNAEAARHAEAATQVEAQRLAHALAEAEATAARQVQARKVVEAAAEAAEAERRAEAQRRAQAERDAEAARLVEAQRLAHALAEAEATAAREVQARKVVEAAAEAAEAERRAEAQRHAQVERDAQAARLVEAQRLAHALAEAEATTAREVQARKVVEAAAEAAEAERRAEAVRNAQAARLIEAQRLAQMLAEAEAAAAREMQLRKVVEAAAKAGEAEQRAEARRRAGEAARAAAEADARRATAAHLRAHDEALSTAAAVTLPEPRATASTARLLGAAAATAGPSRTVRFVGMALMAAAAAAVLWWPTRPTPPDAPAASRPLATTPALPEGAAQSHTADSAAPPASSLAAASATEPAPAEVGRYEVLVATADGTRARIARELAAALSTEPAAMGVVPLADHADPITWLQAPGRLAIARLDALREARGSAAPPLRVLTPLFSEAVLFVVRADSPLKYIHEISGRRLSIGPVGGDESHTVREIYRRLFGAEMTEPAQLETNRALAELLAFRSIDAMAIIEPRPLAWWASLDPGIASRLRLLTLHPRHPADRRLLRSLGTPVARIAAGAPKGMLAKTPAVMSYLVASGERDVDVDRLTAMARALCRELPRLRKHGDPIWRELQPLAQLDTGWPVVQPFQSALTRCARRQVRLRNWGGPA